MTEQFYLTQRWDPNSLVQSEIECNVMKEYSTFLKALEMKPHHQMQFSVITRILVDGRYLQP